MQERLNRKVRRRRQNGENMEDYQIVNLYWDRNEKAIQVTDRKYGRMLNSLSYSILTSREDAEECVNDTYLDAWHAMPTERPTYLGAFLSKIARRISIDRYRAAHRQKRGGYESIMEELTECIPDTMSVERAYQNARIAETLDRFLSSLDPERRVMFVRRYYLSRSIPEIAQEMCIGESKVKVSLFRMRETLRKILERENLL